MTPGRRSSNGAGYLVKTSYVLASHPASDDCGVTLAELLHVSVPRFLYLYRGDTASTLS